MTAELPEISIYPVGIEVGVAGRRQMCQTEDLERAVIGFWSVFFRSNDPCAEAQTCFIFRFVWSPPYPRFPMSVPPDVKVNILNGGRS